MLELTLAPLLTIALLVIVLSFVAAILSDKLKVSHSTVLIAFGFILSLFRTSSGLGEVPLDNSIILGLVVPPVMFEAAMRTRYDVIRPFQRTVWALAIFGVIISAFVTGFFLRIASGLPLGVALTFGVIVATTDPVSVVTVLRKIKAPNALISILESEAYLNNAPVVILYPIAASLSFSPLRDISVFLYNFGVGSLVGLLIAGAAELLHRLITEPLAETSFTIAVMFGSYVLAEGLGGSGLMAVAIAGLYIGNRTIRTAMADETRITMSKFWEVVAFLATSFAFLLLGLKADILLLVRFAPVVLVAFAVTLLGRVISVYPIISLTKLLGEKVPGSWTRLFSMAGLRGVLSVALALSLPESPFKETIVTMTFGVALLSIVLQGEFLQIYLKRRRQF